MKKLFLLIAVLFYSVSAFAQNDDMKKWQEYMTPGKEHQAFAKLNGDWVYTAKMWMDPAAEPQPFNGTAVFEMLLGGRYSQMKVKGDMMGMEFNGIGVTAYDNGKKVYISTWIDNFGTGLMYMEGKYDEATKKIVFLGKGYDPMSGKDMEMKETIKIVDDNNCEIEMFNVVDGKEFKSMEMKYTRK
jgi:hypothetical protein